jgi:acetylornithine deacetylase/succinyl-diaminopimelate desuccinylase-like protein
LPQILIGVGLPVDSIHAPNEKFDLAQFYGGIETMTYLYDELLAALAPAMAPAPESVLTQR